MLLLGDCNHWLKEIKDNSIDLLVTDPPYGITFMGKDWDKALVSTETWKECYRVLKQGKLAFVMCSPRQDVLSRMIIHLQDAGFRVNYSSIYHTFASGFPKAKNNRDGSYVGFQPKPAVEVILVVSKGKTLTWLDDCRIPYQSEQDIAKGWPDSPREKKLALREWGIKTGYRKTPQEDTVLHDVNEKGRFPANLLVQDDVLNDGSNHKSGLHKPTDKQKYKSISDQKFGFKEGYHIDYTIGGDSGSYSRYFSLDQWWSKTFPFLICAKASKAERNKGCKELPERVAFGYGYKPNEQGALANGMFKDRDTKKTNFHPTVKPLKLMSYLITMGSREGDLVLDPFCGSGTVCIAADNLHRKWLGIERNPEYAEIIKKRLMVPLSQLKLSVYS